MSALKWNPAPEGLVEQSAAGREVTASDCAVGKATAVPDELAGAWADEAEDDPTAVAGEAFAELVTGLLTVAWLGVAETRT